MIDLIKALRSRATWETATGITEPHQHIDWMAAEEITRLREENARLREALTPFARAAEYCEGLGDLDHKSVLVGNFRAAAAATREGGREGRMSDYNAAREIDRDINEGVRWYLMAAYAYYIKDAPIVSDDFFDRLAVRLRTAWETIEHPHKHLITEDDLWCGSLLLAEDKYPKEIINAAIREGERDVG